MNLFEQILNEETTQDLIKKYFPEAKNYYDVLEVRENATKDEIKKAWRKLVIKYHPDRNSGNKEVEEKFKIIASVYETLTGEKPDDISNQQQSQNQNGDNKPGQSQDQANSEIVNLQDQLYKANVKKFFEVAQKLVQHFETNVMKDIQTGYNIFSVKFNGSNKDKAYFIYQPEKPQEQKLTYDPNCGSNSGYSRLKTSNRTAQVVAEQSSLRDRFINWLSEVDTYLNSTKDPIKTNNESANTLLGEDENGNKKQDVTKKYLEKIKGKLHFVSYVPLNEPNKNKTYDIKRRYNVQNNGNNIQIDMYVADAATLASIYNQALANYTRTIAQHPFATEVLNKGLDELTNKYMKIGRPSYVKDAIINFNREKRRILESHSLREGGLRGQDIIDSIYGKPENLKWEDEDFKDVVKAAKKGDQTAIGYIMYIMAPAIISSYWKNYIGPNGKLGKIKIEKEGGIQQSFLDWVGTALKALVVGGVATKRKNGSDRKKASTLDGFDLSKVEGDPLNNFAALFRRDLITQAKHLNWEKKRRGLAGEANYDDEDGISIMSFDDFDSEEAGAGERFAAKLDKENNYNSGSVEDDAIESLRNSTFYDSWLDFCQDEELNKGKTPAAKCFKILLENPDESNLKNLADQAGCSRNTFNTQCQKAASRLSNYDLSYNDLMSAIKAYGAKKIASYLNAA